jgi:hypothetical protein
LRTAGLGTCPRAAEQEVAQAQGMEIIVNIEEGEDGRLTGTVRAAGRPDARPFSGNLEFLALVESLYRADDRPSSQREGLTDERTRQ